MLKGIDPLLSPDLLRVLRAMGHGDEIAIVDGNYPAEEHGKRVVRLDGHGAPRILDAILNRGGFDLDRIVSLEPAFLNPAHGELRHPAPTPPPHHRRHRPCSTH